MSFLNIDQSDVTIKDRMAIRLSQCRLSGNRTKWLMRDRKGGVITSTRRNVCILGAGTTSYPLHPLEETDWELWCCNGLWNLGFDPNEEFRADRWFELHPLTAQTPQDLARLKWAPVDVYVLQEGDADWVTNWVLYPYAKVAALGYRLSFASTFAYQVALAIQDDYQWIRLVGIHMNAGRESLVERANLLYWLGIAEGRGIQVELVQCDPTLAMHPYRYGYDYDQEKSWVEGYCRDAFPTIARDGWRGSL